MSCAALRQPPAPTLRRPCRPRQMPRRSRRRPRRSRAMPSTLLQRALRPGSSPTSGAVCVAVDARAACLQRLRVVVRPHGSPRACVSASATGRRSGRAGRRRRPRARSPRRAAGPSPSSSPSSASACATVRGKAVEDEARCGVRLVDAVGDDVDRPRRRARGRPASMIALRLHADRRPAPRPRPAACRRSRAARCRASRRAAAPACPCLPPAAREGSASSRLAPAASTS